MAKQVLQAIKDTETEAAKLRRDAAVQAEQLVRDARAAGEAQARLAEEQTKQANRQMLGEMRSRADELSLRSRREAEDEAAKLEAESSAAVDAAAELIIKALEDKLARG